MSTLKPTRKISRRQELRQDQVVTLYARVLEIFENRRHLVYIGAAAIVGLIIVILGWGYYNQIQEKKAASALASPVRLYEAGQYREALEGVAGSTGLRGVIDEYGGTASGNLAKFYAADAHYKLGELDQALELFRDYDKKADYLGASALAGEASILSLKGEHREAAERYERAASQFENDQTTPLYLIAAGKAYEAAGMFRRAVEAFEQVNEEYPNSQAAQEIDFFIARVNAKAGAK